MGACEPSRAAPSPLAAACLDPRRSTCDGGSHKLLVALSVSISPASDNGRF